MSIIKKQSNINEQAGLRFFIVALPVLLYFLLGAIMSKEKGAIKIFRDIIEDWTWEDKPFSKGQAWIYLLLRANYKNNKVPFGSEIISISRGQMITSVRSLKSVFGWSNTKVVNFLKYLQSDCKITFENDAKKTVITIVNYGLYQDASDAEATVERRRSDAENDTGNDAKTMYMKGLGGDRATQKTTQETTKKRQDNILNTNIKKERKKIIKKERKKTSHFQKPPIENVTTYFQELGWPGQRGKREAEAFIDYYEDRDWKTGKGRNEKKMENWKLACRNWKRNDEKWNPPKETNIKQQIDDQKTGTFGFRFDGEDIEDESGVF